MVAASSAMALVVILLNFSVQRFYARGFSLTFLNVGQGDAELIRQEGRAVLIDGGPDASVVAALDKEIPPFRRVLDAIVLTHPHKDHVSGLVDVLRTYRVKMVVAAGVIYDTPEYDAFLREVSKQHILMVRAQRGVEVRLGSLGKISFLAPQDDEFALRRITLPHESMVVARYSYGDQSVLLAGDMEKELEYLLVRNVSNLKSDILKVGHHGSKNATSSEFVRAVNPRYGIIEVGAQNIYHHPSQEALATLRQNGVMVWRTDQNGTVRCLGDSYTLQCVPESVPSEL